MKCKHCGKEKFFGHQLVHMEVLVDGTGNYLAAVHPGNLHMDIIDTGRIGGLFTCCGCGAIYKRLVEGETPIAGPFEDWNWNESVSKDLLLEQNNANWRSNLAAYVDYKKKTGKEPASNTARKGFKIGAWCRAQKQAFRMGTLSPTKIKQLQDAGFVFDVVELGEPNADQAWQRKLNLYIAYKKEFKKEPNSRTVYKGENLGRWCRTQRKNFKNGVLSAERIERLLKAGFAFDGVEANWNRAFEAYIAYKKELQKEPGYRTVYKEIHLGRWCEKQRNSFKNGDLSAEKIKRLRTAGFIFDINGEAWNRYFEAYVDYKREFGREPDWLAAYNGMNIGTWCRRQRREFKDGRLSNEKIKRLQSAGFSFSPHEEAWERYFEVYIAYKQEYGKEPVGTTVYKGLNLGKWCDSQKQRYKYNKLSDYRIQKLREAGFPLARNRAFLNAR